MANSPDFVAHALELLSGVGPVDARAMFGGPAVYAQGVMFGLLDDDELFLKTDEVSRPRFVEAGCRRWVYVARGQRMENTSWFRPPDDAHEDPDAMLAWATLALESALRVRAAKGGGARKKRTTRPSAASRPAPAPRAKPKPGRGPGKAGRPAATQRAKASRARGRPR